MATLIKVDRNGTKTYEGLVDCPRCGGLGYYAIAEHNGQPVLSPLDAGVCWQCHGAKKIVSRWQERTPEYEAKLEARRAAKAAQKQAEKLQREAAEYEKNHNEWKQAHGFTLDGKTYLFLGDTYSVKEQIKAAGGKFDTMLGWHIDHEVDGYMFLQVELDSIAEATARGYEYTCYARDIDEQKDAEYKKQTGKHDSEWIGNPKDKIEVHVTYKHSAYFNGYMGASTYIHTFETDEGNIIIWKTGNPLEYVDEHDFYRTIAEGSDFTIKATVKEHTEYNGVLQTAVTRLKIKELQEGVNGYKEFK